MPISTCTTHNENKVSRHHSNPRCNPERLFYNTVFLISMMMTVRALLLPWMVYASSSGEASGMVVRSLKHTPSSILKPWEIIVHDPNPTPSIHDMEQSPTINEEIDEVLDKVVGNNGGVVIQRFRPASNWLRRQWFGTVLFHTSRTAIKHMILTLVLCAGMRFVSQGDVKIWLPRDTSLVYPRLDAVDKIWKTLMSLTTFLLTYFVTQSYSFWREILSKGRGIQGRLNDINMLLATNAARQSKSKSSSETTTYTPEAQAFLEEQATKLRIFHVLYWATNTRRFRVLLTKPGLERLLQVGYIPQDFYNVIANASLPATQKWATALESAVYDCQQAVVNKSVIQRYSVALEQTLLNQYCTLRGTCATIPDLVDGRMPLAYAHFVQILVDAFLVVAPLAQYKEIGSFSAIMVGILTIFYRGLLDLAKVFLDPLDTEDFCEGVVYMNIGVLIREVNAASTRWLKGAAKL